MFNQFNLIEKMNYALMIKVPKYLLSYILHHMTQFFNIFKKLYMSMSRYRQDLFTIIINLTNHSSSLTFSMYIVHRL